MENRSKRFKAWISSIWTGMLRRLGLHHDPSPRQLFYRWCQKVVDQQHVRFQDGKVFDLHALDELDVNERRAFDSELFKQIGKADSIEKTRVIEWMHRSRYYDNLADSEERAFKTSRNALIISFLAMAATMINAFAGVTRCSRG